jgi:hypothetical protein
MDYKTYSEKRGGLNKGQNWWRFNKKQFDWYFRISKELERDGITAPKEAQEYRDVTDMLTHEVSDGYREKLSREKQIELTDLKKYPKLTGNINIDTSIIKENKRVYAFIGPRVDKWVLDRNRKWITNEDGEPLLDLNDQIKSLSLICAPFVDVTGDYGRGYYDLRFIADSEIFDIQKDGSLRDKNGKLVTYEKRNKGTRCHYGFLKENFARIREELFPKLDSKHSVYLITATAKCPEDTLNTFVGLYNNLVLSGLNELTGLGPALSKKEYDTQAKRIKRITPDERDDSLLIHYVSKFAAKQMHDKIPYSFIGSLIKEREFTALNLLMHYHPGDYDKAKGLLLNSSHDGPAINPLFKVQGISCIEPFSLVWSKPTDYPLNAWGIYYRIYGEFSKY